MQMVVKSPLILLSSSVLTISFLKDSTRFIFWVCFLIYPFRNYNKFLVRLELLQLFCLLQGLQFLWMHISAIIVRVKAIKLFFLLLWGTFLDFLMLFYNHRHYVWIAELEPSDMWVSISSANRRVAFCK